MAVTVILEDDMKPNWTLQAFSTSMRCGTIHRGVIDRIIRRKHRNIFKKNGDI